MTDQFFTVTDQIIDEETTKAVLVEASMDEAQKFIDYGVKVILLTPSMYDSPLVVGQIMPPREWPTLRNMSSLSSMKAWPNDFPGTDEAEAEAHDKGWQRGIYYDHRHQMGFVAALHKSRLFPITDTVFDNFREADFDPEKFKSETWYMELENSVLSALEKRPKSPYRKICPECKEPTVGIVRYTKVRRWSPCTLEPHPHTGALQVITGDVVRDEIKDEGPRQFRCSRSACGWESEALDDEEYPEVHSCSDALNQIESLFRVSDYVI